MPTFSEIESLAGHVSGEGVQVAIARCEEARCRIRSLKAHLREAKLDLHYARIFWWNEVRLRDLGHVALYQAPPRKMEE